MDWTETRWRSAIEPAFGIAWGVLWFVAEVGRGVQIVWPLIILTLAIATARLIPWASIGFTTLLVVAQLVVPSLRFTETSWTAYVALFVVAASLGASRDVRARQFALPFTIVAAIVVGLLLSVPQFNSDGLDVLSRRSIADERIGAIIFGWTLGITVVSAGFWFIGFGLRAWQSRVTLERRQLATEKDLAVAELELRVSSERDRIAQDVHDIMAHSLSVIIAQADGARYLSSSAALSELGSSSTALSSATAPGSGAPGPAKLSEATDRSLTAIADSARESLVEVRMLIDSLGAESDGHSHPTLSEIPALVERMSSAGLSVTVTSFGTEGVLTTGQELAVYRIVQESLTNALKHGGPSVSATVAFDWRGPGLALTVASTLSESEVPAPAGSLTRGIRGMTERARLAGGWLSAGADVEGDGRERGRFIVTAFVPAAGPSTSPSTSSGGSSGTVSRSGTAS